MGDKYSDKVPTIGTKNIGKQKMQEVETAEELTPTSRGLTKTANNPPQKYKTKNETTKP